MLHAEGREGAGAGITTLRAALRQQDLSPARLAQEWEQVRGLACQAAASVPHAWIADHPRARAPGAPPPPWLDGRTSRFVQLALIAAEEAVRQAGLDEWLACEGTPATQERSEHFGVSIGNGMSSTREISIASATTTRKISPFFVPRILPNSPAARVALHHGLRGPTLSHSEACAAGAAAIAHAVELIESGRVRGMVAGGCESAVDALGLAGFSRLRALSAGGASASDAPTEEEERAARASSRPFDARRDGFVLAEGAAVLVLEERDHAVARGATLLGEVLGVGYSGDAHHVTAPEPTGDGAARAMLRAVEGRGMGAVDYVNAHATSTPRGDLAEVQGLRLALARTPPPEGAPAPLLVSSTKGATGHLLGAAGAVEAALTVMAVSENTAPHTRNLEEVSRDIAPALRTEDTTQRAIHLVRDKPKSQVINAALSNSFGFGGTNVSLFFGKVT